MLTIGSMRTATNGQVFVAKEADITDGDGFQEILDKAMEADDTPFSNKQPSYIMNLGLMEKLGVLG